LRRAVVFKLCGQGDIDRGATHAAGVTELRHKPAFNDVAQKTRKKVFL